MAQKYVPPRQGIAGQLFDVAFLLALVFGALFLPIWLKIAVPSRGEKLPDGVTYQTAADGTKTWSGATWDKLGQNATMRAQWEKLGHTPDTAAEMITQPFDYTIDIAGLLATMLVVIGYFVVIVKLSEKEYKDVIDEKFD
jgi:hypothetical protein